VGGVEKNGKLLFDEEPNVLSYVLSRILGVNKVIALQQIYYWCEKSKNFVNPSEHLLLFGLLKSELFLCIRTLA